MRNYKLTFTVLGLIFYFIIGLPSQTLAQTFQLEGLELAKGVNLTDTFRVGTLFAGDVFDNDNRIGRWTAMLSHKGTENIEVCKGRGDIVTLRLTINFNSGAKLVLRMVDLAGEPDVFWDYTYSGPVCLLGGLNCQHCGEANNVDCNVGEPSDLAMVNDINLRPSLGSTMDINGATLQGGRLCHYYPLIPRVSAVLILY